MRRGFKCGMCGAVATEANARLTVEAERPIKGSMPRIFVPVSPVCEGPMGKRHVGTEMGFVEDIDA